MKLLAPAGGKEQLQEAIHFGADAVYLGLTRHSMRARAENFDLAGLAWATRYAHERGVAVHLALNTLMRDEDMDILERTMDDLAPLGLDAVIAADLGVVELCRRRLEGVAVHLSTQVSVMSAATARAWAGLGVSRIVCARELTLAEVARMVERLDGVCELEVFCHGSMCMAVSGRCLISAALMGRSRSASAGACTQPCRWSWSLVEERTPDAAFPLLEDESGSYLLSSNDLSMIAHLAELEEAGVAAIKVEGRAKGAYYVACVTNAYRHVLDGAPLPVWEAELEAVSHRPYSTGFFFGDPTQNPGRVDYARERVLVGVVEEAQAEGGAWRARLCCRNRALAGDTLTVLSPGHDPRTFVAREPLTKTMERYEVILPFEVAPLDLVCRAAEEHSR